MAYFSEREAGAVPRTIEEITTTAWKGIWALIRKRLENGSFGASFPMQCGDGYGVIGHDESMLEAAAAGDGIVWPPKLDQQPSTMEVLDLLEFSYQNVSQPVEGDYHSFYRHTHLSFNNEVGRAEFCADVERVLSRNGIAFEFGENGEARRIGPAGFAPVLQQAVFKTGDPTLDGLLEAARRKFLDPDVSVRREALEKLWDAFERLKTVEPAVDKKASATALLAKAVPDVKMREVVEQDMQALTSLGNNFMIRHAETNKVPIAKSEQIDYAFQRCFGVIRLLLKATNRGG